MGIDVFIPSKKFQLKAHSQPWFTPACASAIAHRNHYFNLHSSTKTDESHRLFKLARNRCKMVLDQAKLEYAEHVRNNISIQKLCTRVFWRTANSVPNNNKSAIPPVVPQFFLELITTQFRFHMVSPQSVLLNSSIVSGAYSCVISERY